MGNAVASSNVIGIPDSMLNIGQPDSPTRDQLFDFIRGADVKDEVPASAQRNEMGDPLHAQPATVMYDATETVIYFATNDGYLHAIDARTGTERWAYIPQEILPDLINLYQNESVSKKHYGLDGSPRVQIIADNNGVIDGGDKVYLFFGMRRGGDSYYALDVTIPNNPKFLWKKSSGDLPTGLGQTFSNPVPARVNISGASYAAGNTTKAVVVLGAGYDTGHDQPGLPTTPDEGNGIAILDAVNGNVLWHVKKGGGNIASTTMPNMNYSFASDIRVIDLDTDGLADRLYASDMGGQVWRFDLHNGSPVGTFGTGGMIAQLGGAPTPDPTYANNRRFYYAPDVALVSKGTQSFIHIGIGSGHRESPNSTLNHDRFYALRDYSPFTSSTQAQFNLREVTPIKETDLIDIRDNLTPAFPTTTPAGWRMELRDGGAWKGEKVLAEARTFANKVYFTTFTPGVSASANDCTPRLGTNRLYIVDLFTGRPVNNLDQSADSTNLTTEDRSTTVEGSIASDVVLLFPSAEDPNCVGETCTPKPVACVDLFCFPPGFGNDPIRTFWNQRSVD
jgi:type IV pilus assembly protein PilY1